ncbi:MAG: hypothetical protein ACQGVC_00585, partial [Myxococcota bacterium]
MALACTLLLALPDVTSAQDVTIGPADTVTAVVTGPSDDTIQVGGSVDAEALASEIGPDVTLDLVDTETGEGAFADARTIAEAEAAGVDSDGGQDAVTNDGSIDAHAEATAASFGGELDVAGLDAPDEDDEDEEDEEDATGDGPAARAATGVVAEATATGVDGGDGLDVLDNDGSVTATAEADASSDGLSASLIGLAAVDASPEAIATATGLDGGSGDDAVGSAGSVTVDADASARSVGGALSVFGASGPGGTGWNDDAHAEANATGLAGGQGNDQIANDGTLHVTAGADAVAVDANLNLIGGAVASTTPQAHADAIGLSGGDGDDALANRGTAIVDATADANSGGAAATAQGITAALAGSHASAEAVGLHGGSGSDSIENAALLDVDANATARSVQASLSAQGVTLTSNPPDGGPRAEATATGIQGGADGDVVTNRAQILTRADARGESVEASVAVSNIATVVGGAFARTSPTASAGSTAIDGGAGNDRIENLADVDSQAEADTVAVSATFSHEGFGGAGIVLVEDAHATADAFGLVGGEGDDRIANRARIDAAAESDSVWLGASVAVKTTASATVAASADASGQGMGGGEGDDRLINEGVIAAAADAHAVGVAAAGATGEVKGFLPLPPSVSTAASADATAHATGIAGGAGDDRIENRGQIEHAKSTALADAASLSLQFADSMVTFSVPPVALA